MTDGRSPQDAASDPAPSGPLGRRTLLQCGAGLACAGALGPLAGCAERVPVPLQLEVGPLEGSLIRVELSRVPELYALGGSIILRPDATDDLGRRLAVLVANTREQSFRAWNAYCPHAGCEVAWVEQDSQVVCPCHLSRFSIDGAVANPPAQADLDAYPVTISMTAGELVIDLTGAAGVFPDAVNGVITFTSGQLPALAAVGGSIVGRAKGVAFPLIVVRTAAAEARAFDARCPHLACAVRSSGEAFACPCHGSLFALDGTVRNGPATRDLTALAVTLAGETFTVTVA